MMFKEFQGEVPSGDGCGSIFSGCNDIRTWYCWYPDALIIINAQIE